MEQKINYIPKFHVRLKSGYNFKHGITDLNKNSFFVTPFDNSLFCIYEDLLDLKSGKSDFIRLIEKDHIIFLND